jgi:hypothetical protein
MYFGCLVGNIERSKMPHGHRPTDRYVFGTYGITDEAAATTSPDRSK